MSTAPEPSFVDHDGLELAILDWGGDGEPLLLLHPTGFCAGLFDPIAQRVGDRYRPIGIDLRAHGASDSPRDVAGFAFTRLAEDVVAALDQLGIDRCVALGESLGGGVASLVDELRPGLFRRLMLCEGIAFDSAKLHRPGTSEVADGGNFMADAARRRRPIWPDRDTVRESYGSRPPLDVLAPEALDAYVRWGFVDLPDGTIELACSPEDEATMFEAATDTDAGAPAAWRHLLDLACRTTVLRGDASNLPGPWFEAQAEAADAPLVTVEGTHFFLQEDTDRAEALVREHLA